MSLYDGGDSNDYSAPAVWSPSTSSSGSPSGDAVNTTATETTPDPTPTASPTAYDEFGSTYDFGYGGWSSGPVITSQPKAADQTNPTAPTTVDSQTQEPSDGIASRKDLFGRSILGVSLDPNQTQDAQLARLGVTGPKDDAFFNSGAMTEQQKGQFSSWDRKTQEAYLAANNKPVSDAYTYNPINPGWREWMTDKTTPDRGSMLEKLGNGPIGVTTEQALKNETQAHRDERMGIIGDAIGRVGNFALSGVASATGMGPLLTAAKAYAAYENSQKTDKPMTAMDAIMGALTDVGGNMVAGRINGAIGKAVGPAFGQLNQAGALYGMVTGERVPNIGASVVGSIKDELGLSGVPNTKTVSQPNGTDVMQVDNLPTGGWSSGSSGSSSSSQSAPAAPVVSPKSSERVDGSFGSIDLGLLGRRMRRRG